jgi:hypothetical protein
VTARHPPHTDLDLAGLEQAVQGALAAGDERGLHVLGYGEMTCVVAWPRAEGPWACKRLPVFADDAQLDQYRAVFDDYLTTLGERGVDVHETTLDAVPAAGGRIAAYCVQAKVPAESLAPSRLRAADDREGASIINGVLEHIDGVIGTRVGIDAQLSNWTVDDGRLRYFDVTTPLLRDEAGRERLDTELFMATAPAFARPLVRRFALRGILDPYYDTRRAALDLIANLYKEDLAVWVATAVDLANARLGTDFTEHELHRYYRRDARLWGLLQRMRRADRSWQRRVRHRPYPFLLPGKIDRKL